MYIHVAFKVRLVKGSGFWDLKPTSLQSGVGFRVSLGAGFRGSGPLSSECGMYRVAGFGASTCRRLPVPALACICLQQVTNSVGARCLGGVAVERMMHTQDSQGQILGTLKTIPNVYDTGGIFSVRSWCHPLFLSSLAFLEIQPRVKSLRSSYTGLYPQSIPLKLVDHFTCKHL